MKKMKTTKVEVELEKVNVNYLMITNLVKKVI